jgi:hypothetical protein
MNLNLILPPAALLAGALIGTAFGIIQDNARLKYEQRQREGKFASGWSVTPGSFRRVAYLLGALALVQILFPVLFSAGGLVQWCVSGGIVLGYGAILFRQIRGKLS